VDLVDDLEGTTRPPEGGDIRFRFLVENGLLGLPFTGVLEDASMPGETLIMTSSVNTTGGCGACGVPDGDAPGGEATGATGAPGREPPLPRETGASVALVGDPTLDVRFPRGIVGSEVLAGEPNLDDRFPREMSGGCGARGVPDGDSLDDRRPRSSGGGCGACGVPDGEPTLEDWFPRASDGSGDIAGVSFSSKIQCVSGS